MQKKVWILVNSVNSANEGKNCKNTEKVQTIGKKRARVFPEWQSYIRKAFNPNNIIYFAMNASLVFDVDLIM